jgi:uncharacterized protein (TIGR02646 family)
MRRVYRGTLPREAYRELLRRTRLCSDVSLAREEWGRYRRARASEPVVRELKRMAGRRNRCYYCSDSRGADIDHFVPITLNPTRTFAWLNLLWTCSECNRKKAARFPTVGGSAMLLDPTADDPWQHLILDVRTGLLAARYTAPLDRPDPRGAATLATLDILNFEAVADGRARVSRRLLRAVAAVLENVEDPALWRKLVRDEVPCDDYDCASWFVFWEGRDEEPFAHLRSKYPDLWRRLVRAVAKTSLGVPAD